MERPIIGLTGRMCSGKDSWAHFLVDHFGFVWQGTSDITREYIAAHNLGEPTRDLVRNVCTQLRKMNGADYLVHQALKRLDIARPRVVSGLYIVPEAEHIKAVGGKLIHIAAEDSMLFSRMTQRRREGEAGAKDAFDCLMKNDLHAEETDQCLADVIAMADIEIDGSILITNTEQCRKLAIAAFEALGVPYHASLHVTF